MAWRLVMGGILSGLQALTESARRADNAELLNALPSLPIERASILEALAESRAGR